MLEDTFFQQLFTRLGPFPQDIVVPPGDDCAGLQLPGGDVLLVAVDQVVSDRHYIARGPDAALPEQVGRKLLARNLSDIAAMGGKPAYCLVAAGFGPGQDERWLNRFLDGIVELGAEFGVSMVGGDLAHTPQDTVASLTILGRAQPEHLCLRSGARPGDALLVTGVFGNSPDSGHHLVFTPRCREGEWLARQGCVHAMIDVSDGLLLDLQRVCRASGVSARVDPERVPARTTETTPIQAWTDGEDYELLLTVAADRVGPLMEQWPFDTVPLTQIGHTEAQTSAAVLDLEGAPLLPGTLGGYDHFSRSHPGQPTGPSQPAG